MNDQGWFSIPIGFVFALAGDGSPKDQGWVAVIIGLVFAVIGVGNLATGRLHPERPNARLSRGLGYVGIVVGVLAFVFGLLMITGVLIPPTPPRPPAAPGTPTAPNSNPNPAPAP